MPTSRISVVAVVAAVALTVAGCGGGGTTAPDENRGTRGPQATGLLAEVQARRALRVSTDPAYPPQSFLSEAGEWRGFDIDVATEVADRLGVRVEFVTPAWEAITAGNWQGRWDLSVGSMTVTPERAEVLRFVTPYYYTPAAVAVHEDDTAIEDVETDLDAKKIGVCGGCTYDFYLQKTLEIPGEQIDFVVDDAEIRTYDTDTTAIQDLVVGRLDAVISSITTLEEAKKSGSPLRIVGTVFFEPLSVAIDRNAPADPASLVQEVDRIVKGMHADGTLSRLSEEWFGRDLTKKE